jgi:hypothetical protein
VWCQIYKCQNNNGRRQRDALRKHLKGLLSCSACSTPYQPEGLTGGFTDEPLGADRYRITVRGNGYTDLATVKEYFRRRAGEIARAKGYAGYHVLDLTSDEGDWLTQKPKVIGVIEGYYSERAANPSPSVVAPQAPPAPPVSRQATPSSSEPTAVTPDSSEGTAEVSIIGPDGCYVW